MRTMLVLILVLSSAAAIAQTAAPDAAKPPASAKPGSEAPKPKGEVAKKPPLSIAKRLQACLDLDDGTKVRLDCYDAVFPPKPDPKATVAKRVADCRLAKDEEVRLNCYNGFAESIPKF